MKVYKCIQHHDKVSESLLLMYLHDVDTRECRMTYTSQSTSSADSQSHQAVPFLSSCPFSARSPTGWGCWRASRSQARGTSATSSSWWSHSVTCQQSSACKGFSANRAGFLRWWKVGVTITSVYADEKMPHDTIVCLSTTFVLFLDPSNFMIVY